jgi:hypothetical protein
MKKRIELIYYKPFVIVRSPEDKSIKLGEEYGLNYFQRYFEKVFLQHENSKMQKEFIESYAYFQGSVSYMKTYYGN